MEATRFGAPRLTMHVFPLAVALKHQFVGYVKVASSFSTDNVSSGNIGNPVSLLCQPWSKALRFQTVDCFDQPLVVCVGGFGLDMTHA